MVWNADYQAFGGQQDQTGSVQEFHGFTGKEYDPETGLSYYNARWYDAELGRFISEDPAADPNNPNLYSYCGNNPLIYIDPTGLRGLILVHGLNSSSSMWNGVIERLTSTSDYILGGTFNIANFEKANAVFGFQNKGLFNDQEWNIIKTKMNSTKIDKAEKWQFLSNEIQEKVSVLHEIGQDVIFNMNFGDIKSGVNELYGNQGDFRFQADFLNRVINIVNPQGMEVDVVAHSMGGLDTAFYILNYDHEVQKFIAVGSPFGGAYEANISILSGLFPVERWGPAYDCLRPGGTAIRELHAAFGVEFYSLNCRFDGVVSWKSSTSLNGSKNILMPWQNHLKQADDKLWQDIIYYSLQDTKWQWGNTSFSCNWDFSFDNSILGGLV